MPKSKQIVPAERAVQNDAQKAGLKVSKMGPKRCALDAFLGGCPRREKLGSERVSFLEGPGAEIKQAECPPRLNCIVEGTSR